MENIKKLDTIRDSLIVLNDELGAYAISSCWNYSDGLQIQCTREKLKEFAEKNNYKLHEGKNGSTHINIGKHRFFSI